MTGFTGSQGIPGRIGFTGSQGEQGPQGPAGSGGTANVYPAFRTVRVIDSVGATKNIIADQLEDVFTLESGANVNLTVIDDDRIILSTQSPIGFTGSQGFTGSIGFTGSLGDTGFTGSFGLTGFGGSYGFSGSQGFTGSQGDLGNIGFTGSQGDSGPAGLPSQVPGPAGFTGSQGLIGFVGSQGPQGPQGTIGVQGTRGPLGFTGSNGETGFSGSVGDLGFTGSQGSTGTEGFAGSRGQSGYIGSRGFTGSRGVQGIAGPIGIRGYTGSRGTTGAIGETGFSGSRGAPGNTGYSGSRGPIGPQGQVGIGFTGSQGTQGFAGSQGGPAIAFRTFRTENPNGTTSLIIADQADDVMTFAAGSGMALDFNEATDTIVFSSTGGGTGGGGSANLSIINNEPVTGCSFIAYNTETGVLEYTPYDNSIYAQSSDLEFAFNQSTDYTNAMVLAEEFSRQNADLLIYTYVNENIQRIDAELASNVTVIYQYTDTANVYLQELIQSEANIRFTNDGILQDQINQLDDSLANVSSDFDGNVTAIYTTINQVDANSIARDNTLQDNIDVVASDLTIETASRIDGDQQVQANLNAAVGTIDVSLSDLESDLSDETNARVSADDILSARITTEAGRNDTQDGELGTLNSRVDELENSVSISTTYDSNLDQLGTVLSGLPDPGRFIPLDTDVVTDNWSNVSVISINTTDQANVYHFLDRIRSSDTLVMVSNTQSYARYEVIANVVIEVSGSISYANISVAPIDVRDSIVAGNGSNVSPGIYLTELYPAIASDVASSEYVDAQDNLRVLKTGDTMTGALNLYNDPQADLEAATKRYVDTRVERTGDTMTGKLTMASGGIELTDSSDVTVQDGDVKLINGELVTSTIRSPVDIDVIRVNKLQLRFRLGKISVFDKLIYDNVVTDWQTDDRSLVPKYYVDGVISDLDNVVEDVSTKVNRAGDTMEGGLIWDTGSADYNGDQAVLNVMDGSGISRFHVNKSGDIDTKSNLVFTKGTNQFIYKSSNSPLTFAVGGKDPENVMLKLSTEYQPNGGTEIRSVNVRETLVINGDTTAKRSIIFDGVGSLVHLSADMPRVQIGRTGVTLNGAVTVGDAIEPTGNVQLGYLAMSNRKIVGLQNPTDPQDAATKFYVDEAVTNISGEGLILNQVNTQTSATKVTGLGVGRDFEFVIDNDSGSGGGFKIFNSSTEESYLYTQNDSIRTTCSATTEFDILNLASGNQRYLAKNNISAFTERTTFKPKQNAEFYIQNAESSNANIFKILNFSGNEIFGADGEGVVRVPRAPTQDSHVANKKYVDDQIATIQVPSVETQNGGSSGSPTLIDLTKTVVALSNPNPAQRAYWRLPDGAEGQEITLTGSTNLSVTLSFLTIDNHVYISGQTFVLSQGQTWLPFRAATAQAVSAVHFVFSNGAWYASLSMLPSSQIIIS